MQERFTDYGELLRDRLAFGALFAATDYVQALRFRRELCAATFAAAADVDLLLTAGAPARGAADRRRAEMGRPDEARASPRRSTSPAGRRICVCSGFGENGLPVGIQLAAKPFQEPTLFRAAHAFEQAAGLRDKRPIV